MSRLAMSGNLPAEYAERVSDVDRELTASEQQQVEERAQELMSERRENPDMRRQIILDLDPCAYVSQLDRALMNLDGACGRDHIARDAVLTALCQVQRAVHVAQELAWGDDCRDQAEREWNCGGNRG